VTNLAIVRILTIAHILPDETDMKFFSYVDTATGSHPSTPALSVCVGDDLDECVRRTSCFIAFRVGCCDNIYPPPLGRLMIPPTELIEVVRRQLLQNRFFSWRAYAGDHPVVTFLVTACFRVGSVHCVVSEVGRKDRMSVIKNRCDYPAFCETVVSAVADFLKLPIDPHAPKDIIVGILDEECPEVSL
jgi:hypothetical protein